MDAKYVIDRQRAVLGQYVPFGPTPSTSHPQLKVPETSSWVVSYPTLELRVFLELMFSGEFLEIQRISIEGLNGKPVMSRDLTQLGLPALIQDLASQMVPGYEYWTQEYQDKVGEWGSLKVDDEFLSQLMWVKQISHGNPRKALMEYFAMPRSSATLVIRRLKAKYPMPREA